MKKRILDKKNTPEILCKGGIIKKKLNGYVFVKVGTTLIPEHRLVAEEHLKRLLESNEVIHHIDQDRTNNNPSNLMLFENQKAHQKFHLKLKQFGLTNPIKREIENRRLK